MALRQPIVVWSTRQHSEVIDDAGISIKKSLLGPQLIQPTCPGHAPSSSCTRVPPLAFFCIAALAPYPDQLHAIGPLRVAYKADALSGLCLSNPTIWATIAQVMHPLPDHLRHLHLPLADISLPLLQQIPSSHHFSLLTLLALPNCKHVSDDTISELRRINTLTALDLRATRISTYGLTVLSRGLSVSQDDSGAFKRTGSWGLRILSLHSCTNVTNEALPILKAFPLLSVLGVLSQTTGPAVSFSAIHRLAFHTLHSCCSFQTARTPFLLFIA